MSAPPAAVVSVGATPPAHFTLPGQVAMRLPVPSCTRRNNKFETPAGAVNVNVALPAPNVKRHFCDDEKSIVCAPVPVVVPTPLNVNVLTFVPLKLLVEI